MRQIVLDTETTGLEPAEGHRIIEIGCVELINRRRTERTFHCYVNPDRDIDEGALAVHGITRERLACSPRFGDIAGEFLEFVRDAEVIIHNAPFDVGFLNHELRRLDDSWGTLAQHCTILDSLMLAREMHPGQRNSLDALCKRYNVDNSARDLHGALLDAEILADVYLHMTGGQATLLLDDLTARIPGEPLPGAGRLAGHRPPLPIVVPTAEELAEHWRRLDAIDMASGGRCRWKQISAQEAIALPGGRPAD
ncbi:MAG: DNA polymerase III subunit epsilon [Chromatiales bacterium]